LEATQSSLNLKFPFSFLTKNELFFSSFLTSCIQFHQHFTSAFSVQNLGAKNYKACVLGMTFFWRNNICKKSVHKMLMKLTPESIIFTAKTFQWWTVSDVDPEKKQRKNFLTFRKNELKSNSKKKVYWFCPIWSIYSYKVLFNF